MNEKMSKYLKSLSPELQEKAKNIKTQEQLEEFLSDNDIELPEDVLEAVSGGGLCEEDKCTNGGAHNYQEIRYDRDSRCTIYRCSVCNKEMRDYPSLPFD